MIIHSAERKKIYSSKKYRISSLCAYFAIIYISTLTLWPYWFGANNLPRSLFYLIVIVGFVNYFIKGKFNDPAIYFPFFIYYLFVVLSALILNSSIADIYSYLFLSMSFFATLFVLERVKITNVLKLMTFLSTILASLAIYEVSNNILILDSQRSWYLIKGSYINRAVVFADSPLSLGVLFGIFALISFFMYKSEKKKIFIGIVILNMVALLSTYSRGALVATVTAMIAFNILYDYAITEVDRKKFLKSCFIGIMIITISIIFLIWTGTYSGSNATIYRIASIFNWVDDGGNVGRITKWKIYFNVFRENWFSGIGIGGVNLTGYGVTESGIIKVLVEMGLFGFLVYYSLIYSIIRRGLICLKKLNIENKKIVILGISLVCLILVDDAILQILESTIIGFCFWSSLAMIHAGSKNKKMY